MADLTGNQASAAVPIDSVAAAANPSSPPALERNFHSRCALLVDLNGPAIAESFGSSKIKAHLSTYRVAPHNPCVSVRLRFPLGHDITFCFPRGRYTSTNEPAGTETTKRFVGAQAISAQDLLVATGYPVYRLKFTYSELCDIERSEFCIGRHLEHFIQATYQDANRPPRGKLWPLFIDCVGFFVRVDQATEHVKGTKSLDASRITILAPYAANVDFQGKMCKKPEYDILKDMPQASTIDGSQGQENDIIIVVVGTTFPYPGFGFTAVTSRLNVLFTRQRCGPVIVGDTNMKGVVDVPEGKGKGKIKESDVVKCMLVHTPTGDTAYFKPTARLKRYRHLYTNKRVARVVVRSKDRCSDEAKSKGKDNAGIGEAITGV
ncbi:hypothetical protein LX32DRAFT_693142 [Colletotrichum zoysiae]|uniref:DNA2/NAM7 helicase-like C-terminal domain-containing protein n=1 Tax=Colletotrichum zoysiae TaxID=1216348 RepID=A0AAD9M1Q5_9PEZI|nr:hypothetical protein LX32DRAFT_693142 [Colletotrichum zoysiae]